MKKQSVFRGALAAALVVGALSLPASAQIRAGLVNLATMVTGRLPFANLTQGDALSVLGVTGNSTADHASIACGSDHQVIRRSGTALGCGAVNLAQSAAVTGTLAAGNGGTGVTSLGNLTKVDDTNVTATLGGTPTGALINAVSLTLGWTGLLSGARGGTGYSSVKNAGIAYGISTSYISGTGTAGTDNTAQTVKSINVAADTLTQVGDRLCIQSYFRPDTGTAMSATVTVNGVTVATITTQTDALPVWAESCLSYIDSTHANVRTTFRGASGAIALDVVSAGAGFNIASFAWGSTQAVNVVQNQISNNHLVVYEIVGTVYPKGVVAG